MAKYLTEEREGIAGPYIYANSLEEADAIAESWRRRLLVPPTFRVLGEQVYEREIDFDVDKTDNDSDGHPSGDVS